MLAVSWEGRDALPMVRSTGQSDPSRGSGMISTSRGWRIISRSTARYARRSHRERNAAHHSKGARRRGWACRARSSCIGSSWRSLSIQHAGLARRRTRKTRRYRAFDRRRTTRKTREVRCHRSRFSTTRREPAQPLSCTRQHSFNGGLFGCPQRGEKSALWCVGGRVRQTRCNATQLGHNRTQQRRYRGRRNGTATRHRYAGSRNAKPEQNRPR